MAFYWAAVKNASLPQLFIILSVSAADCEQAPFRCMMGRTAETSFSKEEILQDSVNQREDVMRLIKMAGMHIL